MKKSSILLAIVVFLVIVWGGVTYVVGNKAQDYYLSMLEDASQFGFVTFTNTSYERGFLRSRAITLMQIDFPAMAGKDAEGDDGQEAELAEQTFQLEFEHIFFHGPLPMSSGPASRFGSGPAIALVETTLTRFSPDQEGLENILEEIPELKDSVEIAKIKLDGTTDSLLEIPAFEHTLEDGKISCGGLKAEVAYSLVTGAMSGTYDMKSIEFSLPEGGSISWEGFNGEFDLQKVLPMFYVGPTRVVVGGMEMSFPSFETGDQETFKMEEIVMTSNSSYDGQMVQIEQESTFGGIYIDGEKYGPLLVDAEVKNLDAQALSDFQQQSIAVYRDAGNLDPDAIAAKLLPMNLDLLVKLLAGDPELNIRKFSLVTSKGDAEGSLSLKSTGIEALSFDDPQMMLQYAKHIDAFAALSVDETMVRTIMLEKAKSGLNEQIAVARLLEQDIDLTDEEIDQMAIQQYEQQLEMALAQKYIVREGAKLKTSMTFKRGELMVNGQLLPILQGLQ